MQQKQFTHHGVNLTAKLEGETARSVSITRDEHPGHPFINLDPVDHELAHRLRQLNDNEFLEHAIQQAIADGLLDKALASGGPIVALLRP